jgi:hypothetical protein
MTRTKGNKMAQDRKEGSALAAEAELFFMQIGLADSRERGHLLDLGHEDAAVTRTAPVSIRISDSSNVPTNR